jgi:hypothetical protein
MFFLSIHSSVFIYKSFFQHPKKLINSKWYLFFLQNFQIFFDLNFLILYFPKMLFTIEQMFILFHFIYFICFKISQFLFIGFEYFNYTFFLNFRGYRLFFIFYLRIHILKIWCFLKILYFRCQIFLLCKNQYICIDLNSFHWYLILSLKFLI